MNKPFLLTLAVAGVVGAGFAAKNDPAVMCIAGRDVPRSEFEYLFNKNAGQQIEQQSLEDYAELFKIYKLKVADALDAQLDTAAEFQKEYRGYARELAQPYMIDSTCYKQLLQQMYDRSKEEVEARHIMFFKPRQYGGMVSREAYTRADSVLTALRQGADFEEMARMYSQDRSSATRGGSMGYVTVNQTPLEFETAIYNTPEGQLSDIIETSMGVHIIKGGKHRKARGTVEVLHILQLVPEDATPEQQAKIKARIDSIYTLTTAPNASFEALAAKFSDDKRSARQGGNVGWFGCGRMLPEFDSASFALGINEISTPVRTRAGWHIIKKIGAKGTPSFEESEPGFRQTLEHPESGYGKVLFSEFSSKLRKKYHFKQNKKLLERLYAAAGENGIDSTFINNWKANQDEIASWDGKKYTMPEFMDYLSRFAYETSPQAAPGFLRKRFDNYVNAQLHKLQLDRMADENDAYRNLLNEYRDGMLLFEVSNRKVWEKAAKDTEGLERYFQANRNNYTWTNPHVKGFLVQAPSDSVAQAVQLRIAALPQAELLDSIRKEYPEVKIDQILAAKGENMLVDALAFGSGPVQNPDSKYPVYFMSHMRVITAPEVASDVRAQVTTDYQNELERLWIEELRAKYPIEVFDKELRKVKLKK